MGLVDAALPDPGAGGRQRDGLRATSGGGVSHPWLVFWVIATSVSTYALMQSLTVPAVPLIQADLHTDQGTASWVLTAFLVAAAVATPIIGRLGDSYGKRRFFVLCMVALALGSLLAAWAPSIGVLIVARVIQGVSGGMIPLAFGIIRDEMPVANVPFAIAVLSSLLAAGVAVGIVVAGVVVDALGYHWLFVIPGAAATVLAVLCRVLIPLSPLGERRRVGIVPVVLLAGWLVSLLVGLSKAPAWGWTSVSVQSMIWGGLAMLGLWIVVEWQGSAPLIDLRLMRQRGVAAPNLVALLIGMASYGSFAFLPQFVQTPTANGYGFGASTGESGYMMLPSAIVSFGVGLVSARLTKRWSARYVIAVGCAVTSVGLAMAAFVHDHVWQIYVANAISGLGGGLAFACLANAVVAAVPRENTGMASGMNANLRTIGGSIGSAALAAMLTARVQPSGYSVEGGYTLGFAVLAAMALLASAASFLIPADRQATERPEHQTSVGRRRLRRRNACVRSGLASSKSW